MIAHAVIRSTCLRCHSVSGPSALLELLVAHEVENQAVLKKCPVELTERPIRFVLDARDETVRAASRIICVRIN
jgi:hypothetical protein